jgi:cytochrome c oxidase subunit 4
MSQPTISRKTYFLGWIGLLALTLATSLIGLINLGVFNTVIGVVIAMVQAGIIIGVFMHGKAESRLIQVMIAGGVVWFIIIISNTLGDYVTRGWVAFPGK